MGVIVERELLHEDSHFGKCKILILVSVLLEELVVSLQSVSRTTSN